jgi:hypothetical protein
MLMTQRSEIKSQRVTSPKGPASGNNHWQQLQREGYGRARLYSSGAHTNLQDKTACGSVST